jgi:hypothetical protein
MTGRDPDSRIGRSLKTPGREGVRFRGTIHEGKPLALKFRSFRLSCSGSQGVLPVGILQGKTRFY